MSKIGIFWVIEGNVIGKAIDITAGNESIPGVVDSPDTHVYLLENDPEFRLPSSELRDTEYQSIPRGRVIYSKNNSAFKIYLDKVLLSQGSKKSILDYFNLTGSKVVWETDDHYSTDQADIDDLFE